MRRLLGVWKDCSHCRHGYRFSICGWPRIARRQHHETGLHAPSLSGDDGGRREDAVRPSESAAPARLQAPGPRRAQPQKGAPSPQERRLVGGARRWEPPGGTYPAVALFHVGHVALPVGDPLLALLAGPAGAPQPGLALRPAMGLGPAPAARRQRATPGGHAGRRGLSGNPRTGAAGGRVG